MPDKLRVFVAHSFDKTAPNGTTKSDFEVADWFIELLRRSLHYEVVTGSKAAPIQIDDKVKADIAESACVIAIFTKRHHEESTNKWLTSQFVLCEAASAIGFYHNTNKRVCGFYEEGVDPQDLALVTISGLELMQFSRDRLHEDKDRFIAYLKKIPELLSGTGREGGLLPLGLPYSQLNLRKIVTVYVDGRATFQNIAKIVITDAHRFLTEFDSEIPHEIWNGRADLRPLTEMINTPVNKRREAAFLRGICRFTNTKRLDTPLRFKITKEAARRAGFHISFLDKDGHPLRFKNQDTVSYQYAWGDQGVYATSEEDLEPTPPSNEIKEDAYNIAEVVANHGLIREVTLELRFEKGKEPLFDKSPFYQETSSFSANPNWSRSSEVAISQQEEDHEMWFQSFILKERNFQGRLRILWRPASGKLGG